MVASGVTPCKCTDHDIRRSVKQGIGLLMAVVVSGRLPTSMLVSCAPHGTQT